MINDIRKKTIYFAAENELINRTSLKQSLLCNRLQYCKYI